MATALIAAIDQGTQSTRVFLFDVDQRPVASHQVNLIQIVSEPGWCEQDPMQIWTDIQLCVKEACEAAEIVLGPIDVKAIGITNQRETTLMWNRTTGLPLYNAIVWHDARTSDICLRVESQIGSKEVFRAVTGLPISTYFSAFKLLWLYENIPAVQQAIDSDEACFGTMDSWIIYQLTGGVNGGVHVTDVTNASRTMLMDLRTLAWHQPFFETFHVTGSMLPKIVSNCEHYGVVAAGRLAGVPITGCLGDQMAALLGQRCQCGEAKCTYGTGCFMLMNTGPDIVESHYGLLTTVAFKLGPDEPAQYALEGSSAVAGYGISWLRDNLEIISCPEESETLARKVADTGGVYFVPAFAGLLAPYWKPSARGTICGLSGSSTKAHICRALLEAICFQVTELLDAMNAEGGVCLRTLKVDGGAAKNDLLMQLQSDLLQCPVMRPAFQESTSMGAALAAGLAVGFWGLDIFTAIPAHFTNFEPSISVEEADRRLGHWKLAVEKSLDSERLSVAH